MRHCSDYETPAGARQLPGCFVFWTPGKEIFMLDDAGIDLDELATHIKNKMESQNLSLRAAALEMDLGAATVSRLLQGSGSTTAPDFASINKALTWIGRSMKDVSKDAGKKVTTIADVEVQLRALPGLARQDVEALVAMVKASYEHAKKLRTKK